MLVVVFSNPSTGLLKVLVTKELVSVLVSVFNQISILVELLAVISVPTKLIIASKTAAILVPMLVIAIGNFITVKVSNIRVTVDVTVVVRLLVLNAVAKRSTTFIRLVTN